MAGFLRRLWVVVVWLVVSAPFAVAQDEEADADAAGEGDEGEGEEAPPKDCPVPDQVRVGAYVNNIQVFDLKTHTYEFDTYIWFKWCNPDLDPATSLEFMNPSELWGMMITPNYEEPDELPDGSLYQVLRVQSRFGTKMPLYDYPFDRQFIGPLFEDSLWNDETMVYVLDEEGGVDINPNLILPGFVIGKPRLVLTTAPYPTTFGDPREGDPPVYARGALEVPLTRPLWSQMTLLMMPLLCVIVCASLMFVLGPAWVDSRIGVGTTALLTIVALQLTYNQDLPDAGYLMMMDKIYLASYVFVLFGLAVAVRTTTLFDREEIARAHALHRRGLVFSTLGYAAVCSALIALAARP